MGGAEARAAILVVNGGPDPAGGRWLDLCLSKVQELTRWPGYRVYVWNNDTGDARVAGLLEQLPEATLLEADPAEELAHPHAVPLQRLYERARDEGADVIVTLDSDAHPLRPGWLGSLIEALAGPVVAAGVWRDELQPARPPYLHASCLCTTVEFLESQQLRLDFIAPNTGDETHDTLSAITERTEALGLDLHKLRRSNRNDFHRLVGGVYGDLIYHHGAGSRAHPSFWGESREDSAMARNRRMVEIAAWLLMRDYDRYMGWLRGRSVDERFSRKMEALRDGRLDSRPLRRLPIPSDRPSRHGLLSRASKRVRKWLRAPRQDEETKKIDFVIIGAMKCATTSLHAALRSHPDIHMIESAETGYFLEPSDEQRIKGMTDDEIRQHLDDRQLLRRITRHHAGERLLGERSTDYSKFPYRRVDIGKMVKMNPSMRFIYVVRNPFERVISNYFHFLRRRPEETDRDFERELRSHALYLDLSCYFDQLSRYLDHFPEDRFQVVLFEDLVKDSGSTLARLSSFLGVDDSFVFPELERLNADPSRRSPAPLKFSAEAHRRMQERLAPDMAKLGDFVGRDLSQVWDVSAERWVA